MDFRHQYLRNFIYATLLDVKLTRLTHHTIFKNMLPQNCEKYIIKMYSLVFQNLCVPAIVKIVGVFFIALVTKK
jgi:hypothetical protein